MHAWLRAVHQRSGVTILHVTHHVADAQKLATKLLVLKNGAVTEEPIVPAVR
jgi:ABC-type sulfate/molybdate transport systems ATPase subunit